MIPAVVTTLSPNAPCNAPRRTPAPPLVVLVPRIAAPLRAPSIRRPRLLIRAADAGQAGWRRDRDLPRLLRRSPPGTDAAMRVPGAALPWLRAEEARLDDARRGGAADYNLGAHVTLLIALLAELTLAAEGDRRRA